MHLHIYTALNKTVAQTRSSGNRSFIYSLAERLRCRAAPPVALGRPWPWDACGPGTPVAARAWSSRRRRHSLLTSSGRGAKGRPVRFLDIRCDAAGATPPSECACRCPPLGGGGRLSRDCGEHFVQFVCAACHARREETYGRRFIALHSHARIHSRSHTNAHIAYKSL